MRDRRAGRLKLGRGAVPRAATHQQLVALRAMLDSVSDAVLIHSVDGTILDVNDTMLRMFGVVRDEACGFSLRDDYSAGDGAPDALERRWAAALAGEEQQFPWVARRPHDGSTFPVEINLRRLALPKGESLLTTVRDVSAYRRAELALRDELAFSTALLDTLGALVVVVDRTGMVVRFNRACQELTGYSLDEARDRSIWDAILLPEEREGVARIYAKIFAGHYPLNHENAWLSRSGERRQIAWSNTALVDASGKPAYVIGTGIDLTDQRRLEAAYAQAQRMESVGRLAGGVAHDFNNLLTVIAGAAELALGGLPHDHPVSGDVRTILQASGRAAALTRQLLSFARRQAEAARLVDLPTLIADLTPMLRRIAPEHVRFSVSPMPGLWPVQADPGQIEQVLVNLVVNARDAMPAGGELTITGANEELAEGTALHHPDLRPGPYVQLRVADTGVGMSPEVQERAFEPFFSTKSPGHGTGLGLATCYGIVRQHGGAIWLDSAPGHGTQVTLVLPAAPDARPLDVGGSAAAPGGGGETILLVEDDPGVRAVVARMLREIGYRVLEAEGGLAALHMAVRWVEEPIALLLTDMVMPELSGPALAEQLRTLFPGLPVLYMSGYTDDPLIQNAVRSPEVNFIAKPLSAAALAEQVGRLIKPGGG